MAKSLQQEIVQRITRNLLDIQILRLIQDQPMWGYKIKKQVETKFGVKLRHSALYPLLNTLKQKGYLICIEQKQAGRTRKVYEITQDGKKLIRIYENILKEQIQKQDIK